MKKENIITSIIFMCIALFAIYETTNFKKNPYGLTQDSLGPTFFPILVSVLIILLCTLLIIGELRKKTKLESGSFFNNRMIFTALVAILILLYAFLIEYLGYIISTVILNIILLIIFKVEKRAFIAIYPVVITLIIYTLFKIAFRVPLAEGIFFS
jgi:putative tricarboxylic transport membrane protein